MAYDEKATVSIDGEGAVMKCAKGLAGDACGYVKGAKVCGKCGAMAVEMKMVPAVDMEEDDSEMMDDEEKMYGMNMMPKKKKRMGMMPEGEEMGEDEEDSEMAPEMEEGAEAPEEDMEDEESEKQNIMMDKFKKRKSSEMSEEDGEEMMEDEEDEDLEDAADMEEKVNTMMDKFRKRRISSMGMKAADLGQHGYVCAVDRKAYPGSTSVCDDCPGGCVAEKGLPGLLHVEGMAEEMFDGQVIDSGYSADADMFVVDVMGKDGKPYEAFIDGTTAEVMGWHRLDDELVGEKSSVDELNLVSFTEAAEIAVKSIDGHVVAVEPDNFEGIDAYAVEIEGFDGKSYDVYVALDGDILGYDKYEPEEAEDIEAEAAEIALKRAFSEEQRASMAKEGAALPDGSYPISNEGDLRNAIQAYGRAKDKEAAKRHIMKRAKALGKEDLIPENWKASEKSEDIADETTQAEFLASLAEFQILEAETDLI
jgi:uncharacterized membrane protein YkoI